MSENWQNRVTWGDLTVFSATDMSDFRELGA